MANVPAHGPFTWSDFLALGEDDRRELIEGELVEVEVPIEIHEHIVVQLAFFLTAWARPRRAGHALASGYKVRIGERRGVMPDLQFYRAGSSAMRTQQALVSGHPDLVVEIVSESSVRYDRITKRGYYARIGVPEYWIIDPSPRTLERWVLEGEEYRLAGSLAADDVFRPGSFEGLEIPLAELWTIPAEPKH